MAGADGHLGSSPAHQNIRQSYFPQRRKLYLGTGLRVYRGLLLRVCHVLQVRQTRPTRTLLTSLSWCCQAAAAE